MLVCARTASSKCRAHDFVPSPSPGDGSPSGKSLRGPHFVLPPLPLPLRPVSSHLTTPPRLALSAKHCWVAVQGRVGLRGQSLAVSPLLPRPRPRCLGLPCRPGPLCLFVLCLCLLSGCQPVAAPAAPPWTGVTALVVASGKCLGCPHC